MKKFKNYYHYHIQIKNQEIFPFEKESDIAEIIKVNNFGKPVTKNKLPKIYIIKNRSDIIYVGITSQSIAARLRHGLKAKGKGGYHGYKFKDLDTKLDLFIFWFVKENVDRTEAIEAEIVYLIRNRTGNWPKNQTEIHFYKATKREKRIAHLIYEMVK